LELAIANNPLPSAINLFTHAHTHVHVHEHVMMCIAHVARALAAASPIPPACSESINACIACRWTVLMTVLTAVKMSDGFRLPASHHHPTKSSRNIVLATCPLVATQSQSFLGPCPSQSLPSLATRSTLQHAPRTFHAHLARPTCTHSLVHTFRFTAESPSVTGRTREGPPGAAAARDHAWRGLL